MEDKRGHRAKHVQAAAVCFLMAPSGCKKVCVLSLSLSLSLSLPLSVSSSWILITHGIGGGGVRSQDFPVSPDSHEKVGCEDSSNILGETRERRGPQPQSWSLLRTTDVTNSETRVISDTTKSHSINVRHSRTHRAGRRSHCGYLPHPTQTFSKSYQPSTRGVPSFSSCIKAIVLTTLC